MAIVSVFIRISTSAISRFNPFHFSGTLFPFQKGFLSIHKISAFDLNFLHIYRRINKIIRLVVKWTQNLTIVKNMKNIYVSQPFKYIYIYISASYQPKMQINSRSLILGLFKVSRNVYLKTSENTAMGYGPSFLILYQVASYTYS